MNRWDFRTNLLTENFSSLSAIRREKEKARMFLENLSTLNYNFPYKRHSTVIIHSDEFISTQKRIITSLYEPWKKRARNFSHFAALFESHQNLITMCITFYDDNYSKRSSSELLDACCTVAIKRVLWDSVRWGMH